MARGKTRKKSSTRKGKISPSEFEVQCAVVDYVDAHAPDLLYCATVGGARMSIAEAKKIKRSGYRKGIPDLIFYEPRGIYKGLMIEIKRKGGRASDHQKEWLLALNERGYRAELCFGEDECLDVIRGYFACDNIVWPLSGQRD